MKRILTAAMVAAVAAGCVSVNRNDGGDSCRRPCIAKDIVHEKFSVDQNPVSAQDEVQTLFGFITWGSTAKHTCDAVPFSGFGPSAKARNGAYANACEAANCDQIVGARYKVTTDDWFVYRKVRAEVTGYPTKLVGVEVIENKTPCGR